ncbi:MAG: TerC family protein [Sphingomonadales bacterium]|nr:TerC family protein [Sphingomonadales bacterium]
MDWIADPNMWAALATLTVLEVILGIDNVIFISIVAERLPEHQRPRARQLGLAAALGMRIVLLASIVWIIGLTKPVFAINDFAVSWRDIILFVGGLFLIYKGTTEIHKSVEGAEHRASAAVSTTFGAVVMQIMLLDIVFSLDSVITAIGMVDELGVMITAVVIAMGVMLWASKPISAFIARHPTVKMLALSFLLMIGVALIADGLHFHFPRGYIYAAVGFAIFVEALNLAAARNRKERKKAKQSGAE